MAQLTATGQVARATPRRTPYPRGLSSWLFLLPTVIFFLGWQLYPIAQVTWLSFTDARESGFGFSLSNWVGLENYRTALQDDLLWKGLWRASIFTALFVPGMIMMPMVLAVLIDRITHAKVATFYRLVLLIPSMIPGPLIFLLWRLMYDGYIGPINWFLDVGLGIYDVTNQPQWLGDPQLVFFSLAVMEWWWGLGYHTMFFLAGLATIPRDLFDAAKIDGASEWRTFWNVTVPRLLPIILVLVVLRFGTAMAVIDEYLIMGGFNRERPTYTWTVYMYDTAFSLAYLDKSYAATIGWVGAIAMLIVVAGMFYVFRSRD